MSNKRTINDFNKPIKKIINLLKVHGTQTILGTGSDKLMDYISDIDLEEFIKCKDDNKVYKEILKIFQEKYKKAEQDNNIYITDFKCGKLQGGIPIRWDKESIKNGYQYIENKKIYFVNCLKQSSTIKMDIIAFINGKFTEFSENYYFNFDKYITFDELTKHDLNVSLLRNYKKYIKEGKPFKALKRLYSYQKLNNKVDKRIIKFLNSKNGKLNKLAGDLKIILDVINSRFADEKKIKLNLKLIGDELPPAKKVYKNKINQIINIEDKQLLNEEINELIVNIENLIKEDTINFINKL